MTERCDCSLCNDERATKELRHDVQRAINRARGVDVVIGRAEAPSAPGGPFLHFTCETCNTEHRLSGRRVAGLQRIICSVCGASWRRR